MRYDEDVRWLLTYRPPRYLTKDLPKMIEEYARSSRPVLTSTLFSCVANWLANLEKNLYKNNKLTRQADFERRMDRVILFLEYAQENKHKDGAYLMAAWRFLFPYAEIVLQCRVRKVALPETPSLTKRLQHPDVKFIRVYMTICSQLAEKGVPVTRANILQSWTEFRTAKQKGKPPGAIATGNFLAKVDRYAALRDAITLTEHGWVSRSSLMVA